MRRPVVFYSLGLVIILTLVVIFSFDQCRQLFVGHTGKSQITNNTKPRPPGSAAAAAKPTLEELQNDARAANANELGYVPILLYHQISKQEGRWARTPDNFRKDLAELYERGYVLISLSDFLSGKISIPAGKSPAVITFDDSTPGEFRLIQKGEELTVDPNCAVGILRDFGQRHPDFGNAATFFINANPFGGETGQGKYWKKKLQMLVEWGFEIGNHTMSHAYLKNLTPQKARVEIAGLQKLIQQAVPGYKPASFAIVQDGVPNPYETVVQGTYDGITYHHKGVLLWAWSASRPPFHKDFDPLRIQRIQVFQDHGLSSLTTWLDRIEPTRFISDGNVGTIAMPQSWKDSLKAGAPGRQVLYEPENKTDKTPAREQQAFNAKGVHVTAIWASSRTRWEGIIDLIKKSGYNAVELDIKDEDGSIGYLSNVPLSREIGAAHDYLPIKDMLKELKDQGIYSIGRCVVMKDPTLAKKRPEYMVRTASGYPLAGGLWVNPCSQAVQDYNIALAKEAYELGFDEVQFDYIRFPEGQGVKTVSYPGMGNQERTDVIAGFLNHARREIGWDKWLSAAIFGFMGYAKDDQRIGQRPERLAPFLDFMSPMAYPSHYSPGNYGFSNPNAHPAEVVNGTLADFEKLIDTSGCRLRPWLQAFTMGSPPYGTAEIKAQTRVTEKRDIHTWLLWNAGCVYHQDAMQR
ncbi:MAG: putative glycoside hydrolase [Bacillota bacterium]